MPDIIKWNHILFYIVFLSQILLISFYFPRKLLNRTKHIFKKFPPKQYPNLYPKTEIFYLKAHQWYKNGNYFILAVGLFLMYILVTDSTIDDWNGVVFAYFMFQFLPVIIMEVTSFKYYKLMRNADSRTTRKADLKPRKIFDFISPGMFSIAIMVYLSFVIFIIYLNQFDYLWFGGYINVVGITLMNLLNTVIVLWNMFGKKLDPYQASEDRINQIKLIARQLIFISIAATIFVTITVGLKALELKHLTQILMSLYFQVIAISGLRTLNVDSINFDVYKEKMGVA